MSAYDKSVEPLVRSAFGAAVGRNTERMEAALGAMSASDANAQGSFDLASMVSAYRLLEMYDLNPPFDQELQELAESFVAMESWADPTVADILPYLHGLTAGVKIDPPPVRPSEVFRLAFVFGAWLLAAFSDDDQPWYERYDQILDALEQADRSS